MWAPGTQFNWIGIIELCCGESLEFLCYTITSYINKENIFIKPVRATVLVLLWRLSLSTVKLWQSDHR